MTPRDWRREGQSHTHRGHAIFFTTTGNGGDSALLCIHGFPTSSFDWAPLWPQLGEHFGRVIAADMIGFGFSAKPRNYPYSLLDQADLHEELLASLGVTRLHVLAHDYGVSVAQELLARQIERREGGLQLGSVTLLNGGLFPETHRPTAMQRLLAGPLGPLAAKLMNQHRFARSFSAVFGPDTQPTAVELQQFWSLVEENDGPRITPRLLQYMAERRRHRARWVGALQHTQVPLRLINGPVDPVSGAHMAARYRELVPNPDIVSLPGIGHYPQVEAPQAVLDALLEFVLRHA